MRTPPPTGAIKGRIDIGGRFLFIEAQGRGSPTVVIERGSGCASHNDPTWLAIREELLSRMRVCLYDRAGLGQSDPAPTPRSIADMTTDLHALLRAASIRPPYILVAHSLGALITRLYADQYPQEVVGLVLIDATDEQAQQRALITLGPPTPGEPEAVQAYRATLTAQLDGAVDLAEPVDLLASQAQFQNLRPLGDKPLVVITGGKHTWAEGLPDDLVERLEQAYQTHNDALADQSPNGMRITLHKRGQYPQVDAPALVTDAIRWVADSALSINVIS